MAEKVCWMIHVVTPAEVIEKGVRIITGRVESPTPPKAPSGLAETAIDTSNGSPGG